jgi:hypothetical protein
VVERIEDRDDDGEGALRWQRAGALQQFAQRHPVHERHRVVGEPFALAHEVDGEDVGVLEPGGGAGLALEALDHAGGPGDVGAQDFHREPALEILVPDFVDFGEAARADQALDLVLGAEGAGETGEGIGGEFGHRRYYGESVAAAQILPDTSPP